MPDMRDFNYEAGLAYKRGDYDTAARLITEAREQEPDRAALWDHRERRIKFAESQCTPLDELLARRRERAGIEPDDPGLALWVLHNQAVFDREIGE
jgi:hypothetical protein